MPRTCSVCASPQRAEIESSIAAGESYRVVSERFGTSPAALTRHAAHNETGAAAEPEPRVRVGDLALVELAAVPYIWLVDAVTDDRIGLTLIGPPRPNSMLGRLTHSVKPDEILAVFRPTSRS